MISDDEDERVWAHEADSEMVEEYSKDTLKKHLQLRGMNTTGQRKRSECLSFDQLG
ncbi:hypothetical protein PROFUN_10215 [Planoprotostelium fungivorum]|uniref:Uncharacterized protein n=1 Tax=Planoprotostelium fungivorum TaxID=1890364 RepID=A0A2P6MQ65_9EUKA|nr:hypothetical protein PROFUN_10215 [Planoprotostelium fungivorum]